MSFLVLSRRPPSVPSACSGRTISPSESNERMASTSDSDGSRGIWSFADQRATCPCGLHTGLEGSGVETSIRLPRCTSMLRKSSIHSIHCGGPQSAVIRSKRSSKWFRTARLLCPAPVFDKDSSPRKWDRNPVNPALFNFILTAHTAMMLPARQSRALAKARRTPSRWIAPTAPSFSIHSRALCDGPGKLADLTTKPVS